MNDCLSVRSKECMNVMKITDSIVFGIITCHNEDYKCYGTKERKNNQ